MTGARDGTAERHTACDTVPRTGRPDQRRSRTETVRRLGTLSAGLALLALPLCGCAVAARALTAAEAISALNDVLDLTKVADHPARADEDSHAVVSNTRGSGLRLNRGPGTGRLTVLPEGTVVSIVCRTTGPRVDGPHGWNSSWSQVVTTDGRTGFMANAFLTFENDPSTDPVC